MEVRIDLDCIILILVVSQVLQCVTNVLINSTLKGLIPILMYQPRLAIISEGGGGSFLFP